MKKKFKLHYQNSDEYFEVDSFDEVNKWFLESSARNEVRYKGSYAIDMSDKFGNDWKQTYVLNYVDRDGNLYLDIAYCNFLDDNYVVFPKLDGTIFVSYSI